jgi:hypothetical protein
VRGEDYELTECVRARLAKIKQSQAKSLSNRARPLGRKCLLRLTFPSDLSNPKYTNGSWVHADVLAGHDRV